MFYLGAGRAQTSNPLVRATISGAHGTLVQQQFVGSGDSSVEMSLEAAAAVDQLQADESVGLDQNMQMDGCVDKYIGLQVDGMNDGEGDEGQVRLCSNILFYIPYD